MPTCARTAPRGVHALLINGTAGVGKTTIAEAVGDLLADSGSLMSCSTSTG
ncbi:ATP-binding protein [Streptomyces sp. NPDC001076]